MALRYCPHCQQTVTARRQFGIGTLLLVLVTGGLWLLVLGCYLKRCPICKSHFLGKDAAPDAQGDGRRTVSVPTPPTDYDARLDHLVQTRHHEGRWARWGLWLLGASVSLPVVLGFLTLLPPMLPAPPAPASTASPPPSVPPPAPAARQAPPAPLPQGHRPAQRERHATAPVDAGIRAPVPPSALTWDQLQALPPSTQAALVVCQEMVDLAATTMRLRAQQGWSLKDTLSVLGVYKQYAHPSDAEDALARDVVRWVYANPAASAAQAHDAGMALCQQRLGLAAGG